MPKDAPKKEEPKPVVKEEPKPAPTEEPKIERRSRAAAAAEREKNDKERKEKEDAEKGPMAKTDRNAIMEQMKRLQEGFELDVEATDSDISDDSLSESGSDDERIKQRVKARMNNIKKGKQEDEEDLSDLDLLDPFGSEPVPVVKKKVSRGA